MSLKKLHVLFMASSVNVGLTFNWTRLAIALMKTAKITVVSTSKEEHKGLFEELRRRGIKYYSMKDLELLTIKNLISVARKIGKIIENEKIDVIHAQGIRHMIIAFFATRFFSGKKRKPIVVSIHSTLHGRRFENITPIVESFLLNFCADMVLPVSESAKRKLVSLGLSSKKVITVHNGIDLSYFDKTMRRKGFLDLLPSEFTNPSCILIGYFAKMVPHKGHEYLIRAFSEVVNEFPNARLVCTGTGPLKEKLVALCENLGIQDMILFTGKIEYNSLYQILKRIDLYAFPSLAELFPFAILEPMAASKPIVASAVGGVPEALDNGKTGILVPPKDHVKISEAILYLIRQPLEAKRLGKNCRILMEKKFDLVKITSRLNKCYNLAAKRSF
jgi:glycosyltransferase involved in cell wall biosynthesis